MDCSHCGAENEEGSLFCRECGEPLQPDTSASRRSARAATPKARKGLIVGTAVVLVVSVGALLIYLLSGIGSWENPVKTYMHFIVNAELDRLLENYPEELLPEAQHQLLERELEQLDEDVREVYEELEEQELEWSIEYEIVRDRDFSDHQLEQLQQEYEEELGADVEIEEAKEVELELTERIEDKSRGATLRLTVIRVDGIWYLDVRSILSGLRMIF